jgi:excalibur calcium-binding domain-containing protein
MRVRTFAAGVVLATTSALPLAGVADAQPADRDCDDFATQQEAQAALDAQVSDPERLDADNDGVACEWLLTGSSTTISGQVRFVPQGGLETGDGTMAEDTGSEMPVIVGLVLALAGIRRWTARRSS